MWVRAGPALWRGSVGSQALHVKATRLLGRVCVLYSFPLTSLKVTVFLGVGLPEASKCVVSLRASRLAPQVETTAEEGAGMGPSVSVTSTSVIPALGSSGWFRKIPRGHMQ